MLRWTINGDHDSAAEPDGKSQDGDIHRRLKHLADELHNLREQVGEIHASKSRQWARHTRKHYVHGKLVGYLRYHFRIEMCTSAWVKMYQILCEMPAVLEGWRSCLKQSRVPLKTLHLCEAPGGFIAALHYFMWSRQDDVEQAVDIDWSAITLNPEKVSEEDTRCLRQCSFLHATHDHWDFGTDGTGDLLNPGNLRSIIARHNGPEHKRDLVTADGGIGCRGDEFHRQEELLFRLKAAELACALGSLRAPHGSLVIKFFTMFNEGTRQLMVIILDHFDTVQVVKPVTSKPGSAEVYVVAMGFRGAQPDVINVLVHAIEAQSGRLPEDSVLVRSEVEQSLGECTAFYVEKNVAAISHHLSTFCAIRNNSDDRHLAFQQQQAASSFAHLYRLKTQPPGARVVGCVYLDGRDVPAHHMTVAKDDAEEGPQDAVSSRVQARGPVSQATTAAGTLVLSTAPTADAEEDKQRVAAPPHKRARSRA